MSLEDAALEQGVQTHAEPDSATAAGPDVI